MREKPKLETVAKAAGVSTATASQVMRGAGRISDATRQKVLAAAKKLHYVRDGRAAAMRSGENREIGFAIHKIANPFNAEVISGTSDLLETEGYLLSVLDSRDDLTRQRRNLEAFIQSSRGGLLWVPAQDTDETTYDLLAAHGMPTVTFLRRSGKGRFDHVGIENARATAAATNFLADLGHRNIAYLGGVTQFGVRTERIEGYRTAMAARQLGDAIVWDTPDDKMAGLRAMMALHRTHPEITAVVCNGDMVAIGACSAISQLGLVPGQDLSVIGFDDVQDAAIATPPLSTMAVSPYQLGRTLARVALQRIREPDRPTSTTLVPAELVVRGTTGKPR
ncbi:MAG: substrate-binding domain-containing protein [Pseudomonadota bacterium]